MQSGACGTPRLCISLLCPPKIALPGPSSWGHLPLTGVLLWWDREQRFGHCLWKDRLGLWTALVFRFTPRPAHPTMFPLSLLLRPPPSHS